MWHDRFSCGTQGRSNVRVNGIEPLQRIFLSAARQRLTKELIQGTVSTVEIVEVNDTNSIIAKSRFIVLLAGNGSLIKWRYQVVNRLTPVPQVVGDEP